MRLPCVSGPFADCDRLRWFLIERVTKRVTKFSCPEMMQPATGQRGGREYSPNRILSARPGATWRNGGAFYELH